MRGLGACGHRLSLGHVKFTQSAGKPKRVKLPLPWKLRSRLDERLARNRLNDDFERALFALAQAGLESQPFATRGQLVREGAGADVDGPVVAD